MAATYELIASNTLTSSAASVTFSAIPGTMTDLVLRASIRRDAAVTSGAFRIRLNGLTTSIYTFIALDGNGSSATSSKTSFAVGQIAEPETTGATATANTFSSHEFYIPSYLVSQNKPIGAFSVAEDNNATAIMSVAAYLVQTTDAITQIEIYAPSGNFVSGSSFFLYGIKNS